MENPTPTRNFSSFLRSLSQNVLFLLLLGGVIFLVGSAALSYSSNTNSVCNTSLSFLCAVPLAIFMFNNFKFVTRVKPYQRFLFPALIFPALIMLSVGWNLYIEYPPKMFKDFVADPIPQGITHLRSKNITEGFDNLEVAFTFQSTPEALDEFIAKNGLVETDYAYLESQATIKFFKKVKWNENWRTYERWEKGQQNTIRTLWVSPDGKAVCYHLISY